MLSIQITSPFKPAVRKHRSTGRFLLCHTTIWNLWQWVCRANNEQHSPLCLTVLVSVNFLWKQQSRDPIHHVPNTENSACLRNCLLTGRQAEYFSKTKQSKKGRFSGQTNGSGTRETCLWLTGSAKGWMIYDCATPCQSEIKGTHGWRCPKGQMEELLQLTVLDTILDPRAKKDQGLWISTHLHIHIDIWY